MKQTGRGHKVYKPCPHCGALLSYSERRDHVSRCPKNPLAATCQFCNGHVNLRRGFADHLATACRNPPMVTADHKVCSGCQAILHIGQFAKDYRTPDFHHARCKACHNGQTKAKRQSPEEKEKHWLTNICGRYRMTADQLYAILAEQDGKCAICRKPPRGTVKERHLHVDHVHDATKRVRGFLCSNCNHLIGKSGDSAEVCFEAGRYLLRHHPELLQQSHTV